jgi:Uma2 family endonuclease
MLREEGAMSTATLVPLETYLHTDYQPDREYVDGEVKERNLGEKEHARLQKSILLFFAAIEKQAAVRVYPELRVQVSSTRFRVPDLTVLRADAPDEQIVTHPPLIVVEILSPSDSLLGMREKIEDYLRFGIPNIWIVDPSDRMGYICRSGSFREWQPTTSLTVPGTEIQLDLTHLPE